MHKSPDRSSQGSGRPGHKHDDPRNDHRFRADLARAEIVDAPGPAPRDPELAADRALKRELAGLASGELAPEVVARARRNATVASRTPWFMAAAAVLFVAVFVPLALQTPEPSPPAVRPSAHELAQLELALDTLHATGRRAVAIAGREVSGSLAMPDLGLEQLPYADYVRPYLVRDDRS